MRHVCIMLTFFGMPCHCHWFAVTPSSWHSLITWLSCKVRLPSSWMPGIVVLKTSHRSISTVLDKGLHVTLGYAMIPASIANWMATPAATVAKTHQSNSTMLTLTISPSVTPTQDRMAGVLDRNIACRAASSVTNLHFLYYIQYTHICIYIYN